MSSEPETQEFTLPSYDPLFGREWNKERMARGISIIPNSFKATGVEKDYTVWKAKGFKDLKKANVPFYYDKTVHYENGTIHHEVDIYYGRGPYFNVVHSDYETVRIRYQYDTTGGFRDWAADPDAPNFYCFYDSLRHRQISLAEADSVLESWGLNRKNYN